MPHRVGLAVIGGGIVGLAVARALRGRFPADSMVLLEKEAEVGSHQTGHNSGVVHAGLYYRPGSLKAKLCLEGRRRMVEYLGEHGLPYDQCGKVVVATNPLEMERLRELQRRAAANGVPDVEWLDSAGLKEREPEVRGLAGLWVPSTGITDYRAVARTLATELGASGVEIRAGVGVLGGRPTSDGVSIETSEGSVEARFVVNCAGLQSDRVALGFGVAPPVTIIPFRGEYFRLGSEWASRIHGLVYPVPDPVFPFLDVHLTRLVRGGVEAGPNAVWALSREGYAKSDIRLRDTVASLTSPGFLRLVRHQARTGVYEIFRSLDRNTFARDLRKLVPAIDPRDLRRGGAGVRATAISAEGKMVEDFVFASGTRSVHVLNAVSPAATASLAIGEAVAERVPAH